jgi:membrane associated rhomboid family serine protease
MQIHTPDPDYLAANDSPARFRAAALLAAIFVTGIALLHVIDYVFGLGLARFGVVPRDLAGLRGIFAAPLLHGGLEHLVSNIVPLLVGGTMLLYLYPDSSRFVLPAVYFGPGLAVWLFGRDSIHIGASGLVYGIVAYVFVAGVLRRDRRAWAASILVAFLYGAMVWGVLPLKTGVSWETHLAAAVIGVTLAFVLRARDVPPRKRYSWEDEPEEDIAADAPAFENYENAQTAVAPDRVVH